MLPPRPARATLKRLPSLGGMASPLSLAWELRAAAIEFVRFRAAPLVQAQFWGWTNLRLIAGRSRFPARGAVVVIAIYCGEEAQLRTFLDHHRRLGVSEFVFLDLSAGGSLAALLRDDEDCAVWRSRLVSAFGQVAHWANYLRRRYASGRWCLSLDPSERFVFRRCETRRIEDLVQFLESEQRDHMFAVIVDMYGEQRADLIDWRPGENPAEKLSYFDCFGYSGGEAGPYSSVRVRGGPQRRLSYRTSPQSAPELNRVPLVKWRWSYSYILERRLLMPSWLNSAHCEHHSTPTACLLRYSLLDDPAVLRLAARARKAAIIADDAPCHASSLAPLRERQLRHEFSARYVGSEDLVEAGLLNPGQWF
jgi:hypothetical protein